jgi:hypothetical protein
MGQLDLLRGGDLERPRRRPLALPLDQVDRGTDVVEAFDDEAARGPGKGSQVQLPGRGEAGRGAVQAMLDLVVELADEGGAGGVLGQLSRIDRGGLDDPRLAADRGQQVTGDAHVQHLFDGDPDDHRSGVGRVVARVDRPCRV